MITRILAFLGVIVNFLLIPIRVWWAWTQKAYRFLWMLLSGIVAFALWMWQTIANAMSVLIYKLGAMDQAEGLEFQSSSFIDVLEKVNFVFPLAEALAMMSMLFVMWAAACGYRLIKSYVPTLS